MLDQNNYLYIHKDSTIKDVKNLVEGNNIFSLVKEWNLRDLLNYTYEGKKNIDRIYDNYLISEKTISVRNDYLQDINNLKNPDFRGPFNTTKLKKGTPLIFPREVWNVEVLVSEGVYTQTQDYEIFLAEKLKELLTDIKYYPISKTQMNQRLEVLKESFPKNTVWIWCRALSKPPSSQEEAEGELEGTLLNLTPFIKQLNTGTLKVGGSFSLDLSSITCYYDKAQGWILKDTLTYFKERNGEVNYFYDSFVNKSNGKEEAFFFSRVISENDLIFIRFETLVTEVKERLNEAKELYVDKSKLSGKIYDMIGLVDSASQTISFEANQSNISITGRDLIKLFVEDGCYFYPGDFIPGGIIGNSTEERFLRRYEGKYYALTQQAEKSIEYSLQFVLNALTNTKIVPNNLFSSYPENQKSKRFVQDSQKKSELFKTKELVNLDKKVALENIEKSRKFDNIAELTQNQETKEVQKVYSLIYNWIKSLDGGLSDETMILPDFLKNELFREVNIGEDYIINDFASSALETIDNIIINERRLANGDRETAKLEIVPGIWQLIELVIDDEIRDLRLVDDSIGNEMGSIYNALLKICQEPFVELITDTYKDKYIITARKPPFNYKKVKEYIDLYINGSNLVIENEDVLAESLTFAQNLSYSFYRIIPQGSLSQAGDDIIFSFIKAVHFPEYADIWGEKPLEIHSNYISAFYPVGTEEKRTINSIIRTAIDNLKFLIETNAYLPFTRQGHITINGDRRFKKGTWVHYKRTNEIFYIDEVSNSFSKNDTVIVRQTVLTVSRGMVLDYVLPPKKSLGKNNISYFNIIDLTENIKYKELERTQQYKEEEIEDAEALLIATNVSEGFITDLKSSRERGEGFSPIRYEDGMRNGTQLYSIGYGHQVKPHELTKYTASYRMTIQEADALIRQDLQYFTNKVNLNFDLLAQPEFDALTSYVYNTGSFPAKFKQLVNTYLNNPTQANKSQLESYWISSKITTTRNNLSVIVPGLKVRRRSEASLFFQGRKTVEEENQIRENKSKIEPTEITNSKELVIDSEGLIKNFKVNKDVFNFFLRREQFK